MLQIGTEMTPITISEDITYVGLLDIVSKHVDSETHGQSLKGFWALWEHNDRFSPFPERTRIDKENLKATLSLMMLRHGHDVLEAACKSDSSSGVYG